METERSYTIGYRSAPYDLFHYEYPASDYPAIQLRQVLDGVRERGALNSHVENFVERYVDELDSDEDGEAWWRALYAHVLAQPDLDATFEEYMNLDGDTDHLGEAAVQAMNKVLPDWAWTYFGSSGMGGDFPILEIGAPHTGGVAGVPGRPQV